MKHKHYEAKLSQHNSYTIYLNINHLNKGRYEVKIVDKNKILKRLHFKKE